MDRVAEPRRAVRAVVLDAEGRVLLVRFRSPFTGETWWATVGGGVDAGEDEEAALRRELAEEAGLVDFELGPCVWLREVEFEWDRRLIRQAERYYLVRVERHDVAPALSAEELAAEGVDDVRWWTPAELEQTEEALYPRRLAALVRVLLEEGAPGEPFDVGE